jgi:hypothetical protein
VAVAVLPGEELGTHWIAIFFKFVVIQQVKKCYYSVEAECSLQCPQQPVTISYHDTAESNKIFHNQLL